MNEQSTKIERGFVVKHDAWEIDVYRGGDEGLVKAEMEVKCADASIAPASWCDQKVTALKAYKDGYLAFNGLNAAKGAG